MVQCLLKKIAFQEWEDVVQYDGLCPGSLMFGLMVYRTVVELSRIVVGCPIHMQPGYDQRIEGGLCLVQLMAD